MRTQLINTFTFNKAEKAIYIEREFGAPMEKVWAAWTRDELLDQWWAPKPWKTITKRMDFRTGGHWQYAMSGPDNERHWAIVNFISIENYKKFTAFDSFCDEEGNINISLPSLLWTNTFKAGSTSTIVHITITSKNPYDLDSIIDMGFKDGFTSALENLDELLSEPINI